MAAESSPSSSLGSLGSLTAGEVLVRSTAVRREPLPAGGRGRPVTVTVQKLRAGGSPRPGELAADGAPRISPATVPAWAPCGAGTPRDSPSAAPGVLSTKEYPECLLPVENSVPIFLSQMDYPGEAASQGDPSMLLEDSRESEVDVFISQYATGQKEALRAALMQKTQIIPVHKEVKVQLLGGAPTEKREGAGGDTRSAAREVDSATTIAAATAAAIATAAPLLKVQNDLEAKVNSVSELLQKLQETDRQLQQVSEQQKNMKAQGEEPHYHQRVNELEKQMNAFMVQRIQHLEKLQEQQMNIQSQLISSAVNTRGLQQRPVAASGPLPGPWEKPEQRSLTNEAPSSHRSLFPIPAAPAQVFPEAYSNNFPSHGVHTQKSPLKTPVPRRYAPEPVPKNGKISEKENSGVEKENIPKPTREGEGAGLEHVLSSQETPLKQMEYSKKTAVSSSEKGWPSERYRYNAVPANPIPSFVSSNSIEKTVQKADDLLQDLGKLRREMHNILKEASSWKSDMQDLIKSKNFPIPPHPLEHHLLNKPSILQNIKPPKSILTDAEKALRGVQNNKKVLEENLEAVTRAKDGDAMYSIGDSTAHRDVLAGFRIRRTVDEWIKAINEEIQAEITKDDSETQKYEEKAQWSRRAQNLRAMKTKTEIKERTQNIQGSLPKRPLSAAKPLHKQEDNTKKVKFRTYLSEKVESKERKADAASGGTALVQNEDQLSQVYGKPIYQGHRSTLKKEPYLRFNSPTPRPKPSKPKLIETVKGTKVKSARTQTCSHTQDVITTPVKKPPPVCALPQQNQNLFSPSQDACAPVEEHLIPIAIPLGKTQSSSTLQQPAAVTLDKPHPVTVTISLPQEPPKSPVEVKKPNIAVIEVKSEKKEPPQLSVQVLPSVDIDSVSSASESVSHTPPSSEHQLPPVEEAPPAVIQTPEVHTEEEDIELPGANFIEVTDVTQDQEEEKDEIPEIHEPPLELNGQLRAASPQYNGPLFPPVASGPQQPADILDEVIEKKETIEDKLVDWVEQEVMAKIIDEMHPAQKETVPDISRSDNEENEVVSSGNVEVAGGGGLQLFVNAGVPVDSEMINNFLKEALSETIATMLGDSVAQRTVPDPSVPPSTITVVEASMPTPVPTPEATPPLTPPSEKELPPVKTPSPSPPEMSEDVFGLEKIKETDLKLGFPPAGAEIAAAMCPVVTPVVTPVATPVTTPPSVATPSPPVSEWDSQDERKESPKLPNPWDGAELPLEEEKPSPEEPFHPRAVEMSVVNDEEPEALVLPPQQLPVRPLESLPCNALVPSPVPTLSSAVSTQESSFTPTETETTDRPLSEGEVLFTYEQPLPAAALAERGLSLPNFTESLSSTLRDANEMDYDPPSEGQVLRRVDKGSHRDPVLTLLNKLNQAPVFVQEGIDHLEDSDGSIGELSEGQRPRLTRAQERILMGNSIFLKHPSAQSSGSRPCLGLRSASPGQLAQIGEILGDADTSPSPMLLAELESQASSNPVLPAAQPSCRLTPLPEDLSQEESNDAVHIEPVIPQVIFVRRKSEEMLPEGQDAAPHLNPHLSAATVSVQLPGMNADNETQSVSSAHGDLDSSGTDTF